MESGMQKKYIIVAVLLFFLVLMADTGLYWVEYQNYRDKIQIISSIAAESSQSSDFLKLASELLKGQKQINEGIGEDILKEYGYFYGIDNVYSQELKDKLIIISACSLGFYSIILVILIWLWRSNRKLVQSELNNLEGLLTDYSKGIYRITDYEALSEKEASMKRIFIQLESLGSYFKMQEELIDQEKNETKTLVTDISHQLKTPVAALKACFDIFRREDISREERQEFLDRSGAMLAGLENLLAALINISRLETGLIEIKIAEANIFNTLLEAVNRVYQKAEEKRIEIAMEAEEELHSLIIPHDAGWMCEAVVNILDNGIKYSEAGSCITITMAKRVSFLRIEISDEGIGIPKEEYHEIFKRFYRGNSREVKSQTGSGVGLYLTREIITRQRGVVTVTSGKGSGSKGSCFIIQLPYMSESLTEL
ncbi:MAG: hypothetical protein K0R05_968 [Anaerocolumna sp.]|jgi:signal transduction histidine kinase|nr:hypothetical protein [Anaerocolumna sp.]